MQTNIAEMAKAQLAKEHRRLTIALEMAQTKSGATQEEIDAMVAESPPAPFCAKPSVPNVWRHCAMPFVGSWLVNMQNGE